MAENKRIEGFYWVKLKGRWEIMCYYPNQEKYKWLWAGANGIGRFNDSDFSEIDEQPITRDAAVDAEIKGIESAMALTKQYSGFALKHQIAERISELQKQLHG